MTNDPFQPGGPEPPGGLWRELLELLRENRKYWMIPMLVVLLLFGLLIVFGSGVAAPFLYPFF